MKITVLLAGILDPKWPIAPTGKGLPERPGAKLVLSPFDEAALEIALKIRDKAPDTHIKAVVGGGEPATKIARGVCALNVPDVSIISHVALWNQVTVAKELAEVSNGSDLVLIGREYGDCDDGLVPPMLARLLGFGYFGRVQALDANGPLRLLRESGACEERLGLDYPVVASFTNDRRSRLRKPLMKNVMMARNAEIGTFEASAKPVNTVELSSVGQLAGSRTPIQCTLIDGSPQQQAQRIARLLLEAAV